MFRSLDLASQSYKLILDYSGALPCKMEKSETPRAVKFRCMATAGLKNGLEW